MSENAPPGWLSRLIPARRSDSLEEPPVVARVVHESRLGEDDSAELAVPLPVRAAAAWSWRVLAIAAAAALVGYLVIVFKTVVVAFVVAILLAVLLDPVSAWLRKRLRLPRTLAATVTLLGTLAVVVGLLTMAGRSVVAGFTDLAGQASQGFSELVTWLSDGPLGIGEAQVQAWLDEAFGQLEANSGVLVSGALAATTSATQIVTGGVISLFCLFFFLREGRRIWQWFVRLAPARSRSRIN